MAVALALMTRTLGSICDEVGGIIRTGPFGSQLHESDYTCDGTPVVMPKDLVNGGISEDGIARIDDANVERLSQHQLKLGDIVYGRRGDIGRRALITQREAGWLCGTGCLRLSLGDNVLDAQFLYYYLGQPRVVSWIANQAVGATLPNLNTSIIRSIEVTYPPLPIQRKIAAILSAYDDLIENNTRRIALLEAMAQALYREWFVHFRFPGHQSVPLVDSPLGPIPQGWQVLPIGEVCSGIYDGPHATPPPADDGPVFLGIKNITNSGRLDLTEVRHIAEDDFSTWTKRVVPQPGDIVFTYEATLNLYAMIPDGFRGCLGRRVALLRPNPERIESAYLLHYLLNAQWQQTISQNTIRGSTVDRIPLTDLPSFEIIVPPLAIQRESTAILSICVSLINKLTAEQDVLRRARDLLLPKLVSGEVDVSGMEIEMEKRSN